VTAAPVVRVGIVSWNTAALLDDCLAALPAALGDLAVEAEVVVVDNASSDDSVAVTRRHPGITVIENPGGNEGYAKGMNRALADTAAPVLIALNPDTVPPPGSLAALVARLLASDDAGLVVPRLANEDGSLQHSCYRFPTVAVAAIVAFVPRPLQRGRIGRRWWLEAAAGSHDRSTPIDWAIGAVHVIRRSALGDRAEAPYSERWFMYVEDLELCWWLRRQGWAVELDASVTVAHIGNAAGAQAWGSTRSARFWRASYDFVGVSRGRTYARLLALVNVLGTLWVAGWFAVGARWGRGARRAERAAVSRSVRSALPAHVDVVRHGPPPPDPPP
jgi:GT2 family glycosyltransferase